ncbi:MAG: hypothetical protein AMK70_12500 [Nitrospira bacterium SG8_35_1]|nr:MAG: hypothetical protein AMK70_12500 [Nitrospira bacterium SG8_35_1]
MTNSYSAGESIKAWCPRCNLKSGHTIIAIVDNSPKKIKCNACDEQHNVSAKPSGKSRTGSKSTTRKSRSKEAMYEKYLSRLTGGDPANSIKYNIKGNFEKNQIIVHLKFGIGIVLSVIQINKIEILFKDGPRLLTQNQ